MQEDKFIIIHLQSISIHTILHWPLPPKFKMHVKLTPCAYSEHSNILTTDLHNSYKMCVHAIWLPALNLWDMSTSDKIENHAKTLTIVFLCKQPHFFLKYKAGNLKDERNWHSWSIKLDWVIWKSSGRTKSTFYFT